MYPWDARGDAAAAAAAGPGQYGTAKTDDPGPDPATRAAQAVQVALDRRDNGGASADAKRAADHLARGMAVAGHARQ